MMMQEMHYFVETPDGPDLKKLSEMTRDELLYIAEYLSWENQNLHKTAAKLRELYRNSSGSVKGAKEE